MTSGFWLGVLTAYASLCFPVLIIYIFRDRMASWVMRKATGYMASQVRSSLTSEGGDP